MQVTALEHCSLGLLEQCSCGLTEHSAVVGLQNTVQLWDYRTQCSCGITEHNAVVGLKNKLQLWASVEENLTHLTELIGYRPATPRFVASVND
jgi:phosphohistidine swiveling domain-containing protein